MNLEACLIVHPYTANKNLGAGHDRYAYELMTRLPRMGVNCTLFDSGHLRTIPQALAAEAAAVVRLAKNRGKKLYHATATANAQAAITARKHPLLTTIHDVLWFHVKSRYDSRVKYWLKSRAIRRAASRSDAIIVPFQSTFNFLADELKTPTDKMFIVPYGADLDFFCPPAERENVPRPPFFPPEGPVVLFVGAVNVAKGIDTLIKCFHDVVRKVPEAKLIIGSSGWDLPLVRSLWENSPAKDNILFVGFIPEDQLRAAYISADVSAFPSRYGFGLSTLESMACGTPTVSGRTLDAPEFIGDAGLMADPEQPEELAEQIVRVLSDSALKSELKIKGLKKSTAYHWEKTARKTADVYRQIT